MKIVFFVWLIWLLLFSLVTFATYGADKKRARRGARRVPEKTLLLMSLFGGAFGGFAAMQIFRHKTKGEHWYFTAVNLLGMLLHTGLAVFLFLKMQAIL